MKMSIYEHADIMRDNMTPKQYISHIGIIQGRFTLVGETENEKIIGLIGNAYWHDLSPIHKAHIATFYLLPRHDMEFLPDYPVKVNGSMYTGFIKINK